MIKHKISQIEIDEVKRRFILENLRFSPEQAAAILGIGVRTFYRLVDECLIPLVPLRPGQIRGSKCTAFGLEEYRKRVMGDAWEPFDFSQYMEKFF